MTTSILCHVRAEWDKIAIQSWYWKGMYTASEDEGDQRKDGSM